MTLVLNEDQQLFRDSAKRFAAERSPVTALRKLRDSKDAPGFDRYLWKEMAEMGWAGVLIPEEYGGVGFGHVGAGLIAEEIGRNLSATPLLSTSILAATALLKGGSEQQKQTYLPRIAAGELVMAFATEESARHSPFNITTRATGSGKYVLTGKKVHVLDGHVAEKLIVAARTSGDDKNREGISLFIVDAKAPGVSITRVSQVDSRNSAIVGLKDTPAEDVVGTLNEGASVLEAALDAGRAVLAAELLGLSQETFDRTLNYLREREQFGVKIGSFQSLQHRAAHLFSEIELVRTVVLRALQALDGQEQQVAQLVSIAKAKASEVARVATNEGVQMHGGIGMTDEFEIGFFMKRARGAGETLGDAHFHTDRFAQMQGF